MVTDSNAMEKSTKRKRITANASSIVDDTFNMICTTSLVSQAIQAGATYEDQVILRLPTNIARYVKKKITNKEEINIEFEVETERESKFWIDGVELDAYLTDLPCIIESTKSYDKKQFYKIADISQMIIAVEKTEKPIDYDTLYHKYLDEGDDEGDDDLNNDLICDKSNRERPDVILDDDIVKLMTIKENYNYPHGLSPPLRYVRQRRMRKMSFLDDSLEEIENAVTRLIEDDLMASNVFITYYDENNIPHMLKPGGFLFDTNKSPDDPDAGESASHADPSTDHDNEHPNDNDNENNDDNYNDDNSENNDNVGEHDIPIDLLTTRDGHFQRPQDGSSMLHSMDLSDQDPMPDYVPDLNESDLAAEIEDSLFEN